MTWLSVLKVVTTGICMVICANEFIIVVNNVFEDTFQSNNEKAHDELLPPVITFWLYYDTPQSVLKISLMKRAM